MLGRWIGVSYTDGSVICYCILVSKGNIILNTTVKHLTADKPRYPKIQELIRDYHGSLEATLGREYFWTSLDIYDSFINDDREGDANVDPDEEEYQVLSDSPKIDDIIYNSD